MNTRITEVRKSRNLTQEKFAEKIGLTRNFVWMIEKGERVPSDRTISDICREFHVNEHWLRTGEGEMFVQVSRDEEIAAFLGGVLADKPNFRKKLISVMARMTVEEWEMLERKVVELMEEMKKPDP